MKAHLKYDPWPFPSSLSARVPFPFPLCTGAFLFALVRYAN